MEIKINMAKQGENFEIKYRHNVYTNMAKYNAHSYIYIRKTNEREPYTIYLLCLQFIIYIICIR